MYIDLVQRLLLDEKVLTGLSLFIIALLSLLTRSVNLYTDKVKKQKEEDEERQKQYVDEQNKRLISIKRSMLRSEYLTIYNSTEFTYEEKYKMTRSLISEYRKLNGNTYIKELDIKLASKALLPEEFKNLHFGGSHGNKSDGH